MENGLCCVFLVGAVGALLAMRGGRQPSRSGAFGSPVKHEAISLAEVQRHRPANEETLRRLDLGPDQGRIAALYHSGRLSRGVLLDFFSIETPTGPHTTVSEFHQRYGWYDSESQLHERRTDQKPSGLLNHAFEPTHRDQTFLVAWDPSSNDHVVFFAKGGQRLVAPPTPKTAPRGVRTGPVDASTAEALIATVHEVFDDDAAMAVLSDRLAELGDPRSTLMSLQLQRGAGGVPTPEERELLRKEAWRWLPPGVDPNAFFRFERGFPVEVRWLTATEPQHPRWQTVRVITFPASGEIPGLKSPFDGALPSLREVRNASAERLRSIPERHAVRLQALGVVCADARTLTQVIQGLARFRSLERLEFEDLPPHLDRGVQTLIELVEPVRGAALGELWLPEQPVHLRSVQRQVAALRRPLSVHLVFGPWRASRRGEGAAWISVAPTSLTIHAHRTAEALSLSRAIEAMQAAGVTSPEVLVEG